MALPPLPPGFVLESQGGAGPAPPPQQQALPPMPPGFQVEAPAPITSQVQQNALPAQVPQAQPPTPAPVPAEQLAAPVQPQAEQGLLPELNPEPAPDVLGRLQQAITAEQQPKFEELPREAVTGFPITGSVAGVNLDTSVFAGKDDNERVQIMKTRFPNLETAIAQDTGETLVKLNDPNVEGGNEFRLFNAEGFGLRDIDAAVPAIGQGALALTGGVIGSGAGPVGGAAASGAASGLAEAGRQGVVNAALEQGGAEGNETDFGRIALHGALGAGGELAGRAVIAGAKKIAAPIISRFLGKDVAPGAAFDAQGKLTPKTIKALEDAGADPAQVSAEMRAALVEAEKRGVTGADAVTAADFQASGVTTTRGQLSGDTVAQAAEKELTKQPAGAPLNEVLEGQSKQVQQGIREIGGNRDVSKLGAGRAGKEAADEVFGEYNARVTSAYKQADEVAQGRPNVNHSGVIKALRNDERDFALTEATAITNFLRRRGFIKSNGVLNKMTAPQAEELRQFITKSAQTSDPRAKSFVLQVQDALDDAVVNSAFKNARAARKALGDLQRSRLISRIADGKTAPDDFVDSIVRKGGKFDDIAVVKKQLGADSPAWKDMKQTVLDGLARKAGGGTEEGINLGSFSRALSDDGIGVDKMRLLFEPKEIEALMSMKRVMQRINRSASKGKDNSSGSSAALARGFNSLSSRVITDAALFATTGVPLALVGGAVKDRLRKMGASKAIINSVEDLGPRVKAMREGLAGRVERAVSTAGGPALGLEERLDQDGKQATQ